MMTRKLITTLLCLMLAVALPLAALADTRHTLTILPGDDLAAIPAFEDFCEALSVTLTTGEKSGGLTIGIGGEEIATVALGADSTGLYVHSDLLSDDVLYLTWDDGFAFVADQMKEAVKREAEARGTEVDQGALDTIDTVLSLYKNQIVTALGAGGLAAKPSVTTDLDEARAMIEEAFQESPDLVEFYGNLFDKMVVEEGEFTDPERDTATMHMALTLTGEDIAQICDTQYMRGILEMALKTEKPDLEGEALVSAVDEAVEMARDIYENSGLNMVYNIYAADEGNTLVAMDMGMEMSVTEGEETQNVAFNFNYDRLTGNSGVNHCADMTILADDVEMGLMSFQLKQGRDGVSDGYLGMLAAQQQITLAYHAENQGNDRVRTLNLYNRGNATAIIEPAASDRPIIGFQLVSGPADSGVLDEIDDANGDTAVNVMKLSAEELSSLAVGIQTRTAQALFTAMGKMPASVIQLLIGGIGSLTIGGVTLQ